MTRAISATFAILLASSVAVPAADGAGSTAGPAIRFETLTHDLGTIAAGAKQAFSWPYRNGGLSVLEITATVPSCGCTASIAEPKSVPPGGLGALAVTYDPAGQSGDVRKTLTVVTNDPVHPRTILTIRAKVISADSETLPGGHPRFTGQSLLMGSCAGCHAAPAEGKTGAPLWDAVCSMCHGTTGNGALAPGLRSKDYLVAHDDASLGQAIAYGTANPKMPGFSRLMGGPLDEAQIGSLLRLLRSWGPVPAASAAPRP